MCNNQGQKGCLLCHKAANNFKNICPLTTHFKAEYSMFKINGETWLETSTVESMIKILILQSSLGHPVVMYICGCDI